MTLTSRASVAEAWLVGAVADAGAVLRLRDHLGVDVKVI